VGLSNGQKIAAVAGFVVLGLSPSFEDWKQSPQDRPLMIGFYAVGVALIVFGFWGG
jgi:hypothetical protein